MERDDRDIRLDKVGFESIVSLVSSVAVPPYGGSLFKHGSHAATDHMRKRSWAIQLVLRN